MPNWRHRGRLGLLCALTLALVPRGGDAQDRYQPPPHATPQEVALTWIEGRFRMPVTCVRQDDTHVQIEEAVVFRPEPTRGRAAIKATFYGIDDQDFKRCFNVVERDIPNRRGILHLHYRAHTRLDTGMSDFRRASRDGKVTYHVDSGKLRIRGVGGEAEPQTIEFNGDDHPLDVDVVTPGSDGDKLLSRYNAGERALPRPRRRFSFSFTGPDDFKLTLHMIEDERRWR